MRARVVRAGSPPLAGLGTCVDCRRPHSLEVAQENGFACHRIVESFLAIRLSPQDFDDDGDTSEGTAGPIATLHDRLYAVILPMSAVLRAHPSFMPIAFPTSLPNAMEMALLPKAKQHIPTAIKAGRRAYCRRHTITSSWRRTTQPTCKTPDMRCSYSMTAWGICPSRLRST